MTLADDGAAVRDLKLHGARGRRLMVVDEC